MIKSLRLFSDFCLGASAVTIVGWALSFTPFSLKALVYSIVFWLIFLLITLRFDDPISEFVGVELSLYYTAIGLGSIAFLAGLAVLGGVLL